MIYPLLTRQNCIATWLERRATCPICRAPQLDVFDVGYQPRIADDALLHIVCRQKGATLETKLASAPAWLERSGIAKWRYNGRNWSCKVDPTKKTHIDVFHCLICISISSPTGAGITRGIDATEIHQLCEEFNRQTSMLAHCASDKAQIQKFKQTQFRFGDFLIACVVQYGPTLSIRLAEGPRWIFESRRTFFLNFEDDIWECSFTDVPQKSRIAVDDKKIRLAPDAGTFSSTLTIERVTALFDAIRQAQPAWAAALEQERAGARQLRAEQMTKHGLLKRGADESEDRTEEQPDQ